MAGSLEFVHELKFLLTPQRAEAVISWARARLDADPYGGGVAGDLYQVSSIYFDTHRFDVFQRHGSFGRSKYRIRRYESGTSVFLERKTKTSTRVYKRRAQVQFEQLTRLAQSPPDADWAGYWFHRRLAHRQLEPVCRINYQRLARVATSAAGQCRLTLDRHLIAWPVAELHFGATTPGTPLPHEPLILELKYGRSMPALFKQLIHEFTPVPQGVSKYRLALLGLGLGPEAGARAAHAVPVHA